MATSVSNPRLALTFIIITLTIDAMGIGLILPVLPTLIREITGADLGQAAVWGGIMTTIFAGMQFIFGPIVGSLSDRYGRRPILLGSLFVVAVDFVIMGMAQAMWLLILTRVIGGIATSTQSTAAAFIADISPPEKRAANFGLIGAAFGVGFVLGPFIGGALGEFGPRMPFFAAAALAAINMVFGYFVLPETVSREKRRPFDLKRANPFGAFKSVGKLEDVQRLLVIAFLYEFAFIVYPVVWAYFTPERFGWSEWMVGVSLGTFGISIAIVQGFLIRIIIPKLGVRATILYGFIFNTGIFIALAFITNGWLVLALTPISALGAVVVPALQGMMSQRAGDDQQGELQGVITSAKALALIISPLVMTQLFFLFTREGGTYQPGAPFLLSAALVLACLIVFVTRKRRTDVTG
ncbi:MAG: TCR/Tet family MFS transporter [Rhodobacteraceae bacterium]|nr:TCR/Tet family MFS transporter [Paracoccaceae bacterium]